MKANDGDTTLPRVSEPEWVSPNSCDDRTRRDAMRVRDFSVARSKRSNLISAPFALHDAVRSVFQNDAMSLIQLEGFSTLKLAQLID